MMRRTIVLLAAALLAPACASAEKEDDGRDSRARVNISRSAPPKSSPDPYRVPSELVMLYDEASPTGVIEIELNRDGTVAEMEVETPVDAIPREILDAAETVLPGGTVTGAELEIVDRRRCWEVKKRIGDLDYELVFDADGRLLERESEIRREDAPAAVFTAAEAALPGGNFKSVERIEVGPTTVYHLKYEIDGATYKLVIEPDGDVVRRVREQRAEIEIPLK